VKETIELRPHLLLLQIHDDHKSVCKKAHRKQSI
jgi:hypothetical protein